MVRRPWRYWFTTSTARVKLTGIPLVIFQVSGLWQIHAVELATAEPGHDAHARPVDGGTGLERVDEAPVAALERRANAGLADLLAQRDAQVVGAADERDVRVGSFEFHGSQAPWKVRLMTSICCSRVSRTKFTA